MNIWFRKVLLFTMVWCLCLLSVGQVTHMSQASAAEIKSTMPSQAQTITSLITDKNDLFNDLMFLKPILKDKRIVSLGEASHGASEYNSVKVRLVKFLHEQLGYDVISFESNLSDATVAYAQISKSTPKQLMEDAIYGVWQVQENLPLFEYIVEQSKTDHPLILTGFDSQEPTDSFINFIEDWFAKVDKSKAKAFAQTEHWYEKLNMIDNVEDFNSQQHNMKEKYIALQTFVKNNQVELRKNQENPKLISIIERVFQNRIDMIDNYHPHIINLLAGIEPEKNVKRGSYERDRVMAGNVDWLANSIYPTEKIILWGHNYHIRKNNSTMITEHNGFGYDHQPYPTMGEMLPFSLKQNAYVIGLYAYQGSSSKNNGEEEQVKPHEKGSLEQILGMDMGTARFIDMRDTTLSPATEWMYTPRTAKAWGVLDEKMIPRDQYDGILLIKKIHPSKP